MGTPNPPYHGPPYTTGPNKDGTTVLRIQGPLLMVQARAGLGKMEQQAQAAYLFLAMPMLVTLVTQYGFLVKCCCNCGKISCLYPLSPFPDLEEGGPGFSV